MISVDYEVSIARSPSDVFDFITTIEEYADWQREAGLTGARRVAPGPIGPGSQFVLERRGRRSGTVEMKCEVTGFEPGRRFTFHGRDSDGLTSDFDTTLTPEAGGTLLHWTVRIAMPNLLGRLLEPMVRREVLRSARLDFPALKARLETH
jgi:uncharacterized protein YndB with AHSA1/START domain